MSAVDLTPLLRFLTQDASIPLASAIALAKPLHAAGYTQPSAFSTATPASLKPLVTAADTGEKLDPESKLAKQIVRAAKRLAKKRLASDEEGPPSQAIAKKQKRIGAKSDRTAGLEGIFALPEAIMDSNEIGKTSLFTNRAPLMLALLVVMMGYTLPSQPLSSRLSLAQAVVSVGARKKAQSLGIEQEERTGNEVGPRKGYQSLKILGNDIAVVARDIQDVSGAAREGASIFNDDDEAGNPKQCPAYWGLDIQALNNNSYGAQSASTNISLPIHTPQTARSYLLRSFASMPSPDAATRASQVKTKASQASDAAIKGRNLALLLGALDMLFASWTEVLSLTELDRRAWTWYVTIRPEVAEGKAGWGGKGEVKLKQILSLRRGE